MSKLTAAAYHIPAETIKVGDVLLDRHNRASAVVARFTDDEHTATVKTADGNWHYLPFGKEIRISA